MGAAIGLNLLTGVPLCVGAVLVAVAVGFLLLANGYRRIEKLIIAFVSLIGLSFLYELSLVHVPWAEAAAAWVTPSFPSGSIPIVMSVLGAVVMPHNLYLHSEIIQSRRLNEQGTAVIEKQLRFEFVDTLTSMLVGWAINSSMIILAAATFFVHHSIVTDLGQAQSMLQPLLGKAPRRCSAVRCSWPDCHHPSQQEWPAAALSPACHGSRTMCRTITAGSVLCLPLEAHWHSLSLPATRSRRWS